MYVYRLANSTLMSRFSLALVLIYFGWMDYVANLITTHDLWLGWRCYLPDVWLPCPHRNYHVSRQSRHTCMWGCDLGGDKCAFSSLIWNWKMPLPFGTIPVPSVWISVPRIPNMIKIMLRRYDVTTRLYLGMETRPIVLRASVILLLLHHKKEDD
jgi:hypothetical protein